MIAKPFIPGKAYWVNGTPVLASHPCDAIIIYLRSMTCA